MKKIIIDCSEITSKRALHDTLAERLDAPDYYGRNLDALYDVLTDLNDTCIILENSEALEQNLGGYGELVIAVMRDAAERNDKLKIKII